jgi:hypothetical protein
MVYFENHSYSVPFMHVGKEIEVRCCAGKVQILAGGKVIREHPRGTRERLIYDPGCYEGDGDDRVVAPPALGRMGSRLQEIVGMPVEERPLDLYAALAGCTMKGRKLTIRIESILEGRSQSIVQEARFHGIVIANRVLLRGGFQKCGIPVFMGDWRISVEKLKECNFCDFS